MNEEFRHLVIETLRRGEDLPAEWARELFPPEKREYELVYHGKEREEDILANTMAVPLQPVTTFGKNGEDWHNMLIFGDNLQAMKTLLKMKEQGQLINANGKTGVKLVYIDPPFATKREFSANQEQKAYQDKVVGAQFIEFLRRRIILIHKLLTPDGFLILHLDHRYVSHLRILIDEVFGRGNFRNEIFVKRSTKSVQSQFEQISALAVANYTLLFYSKSPDTRTRKLTKSLDSTAKGKWDTYWRSPDRPTMRYEIFDIIPERGQWRWSKERGYRAKENYIKFLQEGGTDEAIDEYFLSHFEITGEKLDFVRLGPSDSVQYYVPPRTSKIRNNIWMDIPSSSRITGYPTEKSEQLLDRIIAWLSEPNDIVLDSFAGSGTTLAVAEKIERRWIGIDSGKLAIYTIQKRMLNLKKNIGNKGQSIQPKPFTLYNAGLYDFSTLRQLPWEDWRFFALQLFECKDEPHTIGGLQLDGKRRGASVLIFNHLEHPGQRLDEETVYSIHLAVGKKIEGKFYIIAPRAVFDFQQDYIDYDGVRYYALRIPYSFINELHHKEFTALEQPKDETAVNSVLDAVGFDFIRPPEVVWSVGIAKHQDQLIEEACLKVESFESRAYIRGKDTRSGLETFSMLMLDFDYTGGVFNPDAFFLAQQLETANWEVWFPKEELGEQVMAVFIDIYGNEAREVIPREEFGVMSTKADLAETIAKGVN